MRKYLKYIYYLFFILAFLFLIEAYKNFEVDREKAYMQIGFSVILVAYGLFRIKYMKKMEAYHRNKNSNNSDA